MGFWTSSVWISVLGWICCRKGEALSRWRMGCFFSLCFLAGLISRSHITVDYGKLQNMNDSTTINSPRPVA